MFQCMLLETQRALTDMELASAWDSRSSFAAIFQHCAEVVFVCQQQAVQHSLLFLHTHRSTPRTYKADTYNRHTHIQSSNHNTYATHTTPH